MNVDGWREHLSLSRAHGVYGTFPHGEAGIGLRWTGHTSWER